MNYNNIDVEKNFANIPDEIILEFIEVLKSTHLSYRTMIMVESCKLCSLARIYSQNKIIVSFDSQNKIIAPFDFLGNKLFNWCHLCLWAAFTGKVCTTYKFDILDEIDIYKKECKRLNKKVDQNNKYIKARKNRINQIKRWINKLELILFKREN